MKKARVKEVAVRNLEDLVDIVNCNADSLVRQIKRASRNSRRITILSGVVVAIAIISAQQWQKLEEQVYNLSVRVKKLENGEGE